MKKICLIFGLIFVITGCSFSNTKESNQKAEESVSVEKNSNEELNIENGKFIEDEIDSIIDDSDEWSKTLAKDGTLLADFNNDGKDDTIQLEYKTEEGSQVISKFTLSIFGIDESFLLDNYDASFVNLEIINSEDADDSDELWLLFDTHGGGGQGTHDVYVAKILDNTLEVVKLDGRVEGTAEIDESWQVDGIYQIEKVLYKDIQQLMAHQYVWGEQGHSDEKGDLVSLVTLDGDKLIVTDSWMNLIN